jgi:hypothetical protein
MDLRPFKNAGSLKQANVPLNEPPIVMITDGISKNDVYNAEMLSELTTPKTNIPAPIKIPTSVAISMNYTFLLT